MRSIYDYSVVIFDCDGVIFDSNNLKIQAMTQTLLGESVFNNEHVAAAINYFKNNFGISRTRHIDYLVECFVSGSTIDKNFTKASILKSYSTKCIQLYREANFTPGFLELLGTLSSAKYVASGSDERELKTVLKDRGVSHYFSNIYGSPAKKGDIVAGIASRHGAKSSVMVGDSVSDFEAAKSSNISFIYYSPFSQVKEIMQSLKSSHGFVEMESF